MSMIRDRLRQVSWQFVALALVTGGIVHIIATLVVPHFATASAFQRFAAALPVNRMHVLAPAKPGQQPLPFVSPDERLAVCHFTVAGGPIEIAAELPDRGWTLGLYTPHGDNFFLLPAHDMRRTQVKLQLVPPSDRVLGFLNLFSRTPLPSPTEITAPVTEGMLVVRAPLRGRAYAHEIEAVLRQVHCGPKRG